jgi:hypothetical protein
MSLNFIPKTHTYLWNDTPVVSATQLLNRVAVRASDDDKWESLGQGEYFKGDDTAARFGHAFHAYAGYRLTKIACDIDEAMKPWANQFDLWLEKNLWIFHENKRLFVFDWKTSTSKQEKWRYQTAAYGELVRNSAPYFSQTVFFVERPMYHPIHHYCGTPDLVVGNPLAREYHRVTVRFEADRYEEEVRYNKKSDWNTFLSILNVYREGTK